MKRVIGGSAICGLLALVYVPKITYAVSSGRRVEEDRAYSFLFDVQRNTEVDLKQLLLNVFVAALIGGFVGVVPTRIMRRVALALVAITILGFATVVVIGVIGTISDRMKGSERARADEQYAEQLHQRGENPAAVIKLREAATNWQIAGRADEQKRVNAKATGYARDTFAEHARPIFTPPPPVPDRERLAATNPTPGMFDDLIPVPGPKKAAAQRARADEIYAEQLRRQGRLDLSKAHLLKAAENWQLAEQADQAQRVRAKVSGLKMPTASEFLDVDERRAPEQADPLAGFDPDAVLAGDPWESFPDATPSVILRAQPVERAATPAPFDIDAYLSGELSGEKQAVDDPLAGFDPDEFLRNYRPRKPNPSPKR